MQYRKLNALVTIMTREEALDANIPIDFGLNNHAAVVKRVAYASINAAKRANRQTRFGVLVGKLPPQSKDCVQEYVK